MDRETWLRQFRQKTESRYDDLFAKDFDEKWGQISPMHEAFVERFLERLPPNAVVMDAACGTGKYWKMILEKGHTLTGVDQSREMLSRAQEKYPSVSVEKIGLQEIAFIEAFDGIACVDVMEFIPPEEWPLVMANFHRALKPDGCLYFTVEMATQKEVQEAFERGKSKNLPLVMGEDPQEGYHYFPAMKDVTRWVREAGFSMVSKDSGDYYHHFLVLKE